MPAIHHIDHDSKLIITKWQGEATDTNFKQSLINYFKNIRSNSECKLYNEVVDLRNTGPINITIKGLMELSRIAMKSHNVKERDIKLAFIVNLGFAYSFANLYVFYRNMGKTDQKQISVFLNEDDAYDWVKRTD